jgi:hypothetical protein
VVVPCSTKSLADLGAEATKAKQPNQRHAARSDSGPPQAICHTTRTESPLCVQKQPPLSLRAERARAGPVHLLAACAGVGRKHPPWVRIPFPMLIRAYSAVPRLARRLIVSCLLQTNLLVEQDECILPEYRAPCRIRYVPCERIRAHWACPTSHNVKDARAIRLARRT